MDTQKWTALPNNVALTTPRVDLCGGSAGGKIYAIGGYDANYTILSSVEEFEPATQRWTTLATGMNHQRSVDHVHMLHGCTMQCACMQAVL